MDKKESVFTARPEIQDRKIAENETAWAFLTNIPITPGHALVVPKRVVATMEELTSEEILDIFSLARTVKEALKKTFGAEGFNHAFNEGEGYGQSVPHFHLHIVPRTPGDAGIIDYDPRVFLYRPGSREDSPEKELAAAASSIRENVTK